MLLLLRRWKHLCIDHLSVVWRWLFNYQRSRFEPTHEIMALFVLRKLILQTRKRSHPVELDVWFLVGPLVYFRTSCVRTAKALVRLRGCAGSPEPSLVAYVINTIISWAGWFVVFWNKIKVADSWCATKSMIPVTNRLWFQNLKFILWQWIFQAIGKTL